jgi:type IV secretion system protein VirB5
MGFEHKSAVYKPVEIKNPFKEGGEKAYADLLQNSIREAAWWRYTGIGALVLFGVSIMLFMHAIGKQKTVPVLINVMAHGEAQYLGKVEGNSSPQVPEAAIQYQVRTFITNLRSIPADPYVLYNDIEMCYAMVTSACEKTMTERLKTASPFDVVGKTRRTVQIESLIKTTGSTYQADWYETTTEGTQSTGKIKYRALVTVKLLPATEKTIQKNPLGIYIDAYELTTL